MLMPRVSQRLMPLESLCLKMVNLIVLVRLRYFLYFLCACKTSISLAFCNTIPIIVIVHIPTKSIVPFIRCSPNKQKGKDGIPFSMYARKHIEKMITRGQERTSRDYKWALYHLEKFAGDNEVMFSQLTYSFLSRWIYSLSQTARSKNKYPINIRQIHKAAMLEYNDEERGIQLITNPWPKITIPKEDTPNKKSDKPQYASQVLRRCSRLQ